MSSGGDKLKFPYDDYVDLIAAKNNEAFESVYFETYHGVFSMIFSIVQNRSISEDLMQDTYIKMVEKIASYEKGRNFPAWLLQIAKNNAYDHLRIKRKETETSESIALHQPLHTLHQGELNQIEDYLVTLTNLEREIVVLKVVNEMTFNEIAKILELPLGTIYSDYRQAMKKMKKTLRKEQL